MRGITDPKVDNALNAQNFSIPNLKEGVMSGEQGAASPLYAR